MVQDWAQEFPASQLVSPWKPMEKLEHWVSILKLWLDLLDIGPYQAFFEKLGSFVSLGYFFTWLYMSSKVIILISLYSVLFHQLLSLEQSLSWILINPLLLFLVIIQSRSLSSVVFSEHRPLFLHRSLIVSWSGIIILVYSIKTFPIWTFILLIFRIFYRGSIASEDRMQR